MSNPEIAQSLFVTLSTVEGHLRHAYRKLSITSRSQLPAALQSAVPETRSRRAVGKQRCCRDAAVRSACDAAWCGPAPDGACHSRV
jgi:regulatory LuxR family protein